MLIIVIYYLLFRYLCSERALNEQDDSCLYEKGDTGKDLKKQEKKKKKSNNEEITNDKYRKVKQEL